jgi:Rhodopirellula transposase DDE domain
LISCTHSGPAGGLPGIAAQSAGQPVISVDTKKKELIGNFKNGGTDYRPKGDPLYVNVHDFKDEELGKVVPHGI